ncbi:MAG: acylphosphatase [Rhodospirillaceae bacterium]|jgi:acylphosphatase|nr:acylphosphatase [Rhodospirillaceae bacterium]MBT5373918.1 acylphosphatase [Rhodospirillaceae bacterium]
MAAAVEKAIRVIVEGRVQGVFFRAWTVDQAKMRGLRGWVRNRHDGAVEAVFAGPDSEVMDMLSVCKQGPLLAQVKGLDYCDVDIDEIGEGFEQRASV